MTNVYVQDQDHMRKKASELLLPQTKLILEIGCSTGNFAELLFEGGVRGNYLGVDKLEWKIEQARKNLPIMTFLCLDIYNALELVKVADIIVSFQTLEHIGTRGGNEDIEVLSAANSGTRIIFSVPNFKSHDHKRWFKLPEWKDRYKDIIDYQQEFIYLKPKRKTSKSFLFDGVRK